MECVFCALPAARIEAEDALTLTIRDGFPVSPGHTLVISRRHIASLFDATGEEAAGLFAAVRAARARLDAALAPDGYNIGVNVGEAAGQSVMHLHVHVIPRYRGDTPRPRGGVRHVIPCKGDY